MMPVIRLNDATFADLKAISTWLSTNTPSETVDRLVREKLEQLGLERDAGPEPQAQPENDKLKFDKAPGLAFTRLLSAKIGGTHVKKTNWASLLLDMIAAVKAKGLSKERLVEELQIPAKATAYSKEGYKYYPELGLSVQGQAAQDAWKEVDRLAQKWAIPVEVEFQWRQNEKAQHPGRTGILCSGMTR
jgi:plasmid stabilization system protein ParE